MANQATNQEDKLTPEAKAFLDGHLSKIRERIIEAAVQDLGDTSESSSPIEPMLIAEASKKFAPGALVPVDARKVSAIQRVLEPITGLTFVCAVLAVLFGVLGLWADKTNSAGWLDIAKVFAGAVVGSTGAGVVSTAKGSTSRER